MQQSFLRAFVSGCKGAADRSFRQSFSDHAFGLLREVESFLRAAQSCCRINRLDQRFGLGRGKPFAEKKPSTQSLGRLLWLPPSKATTHGPFPTQMCPMR